MEDIVNGGIFNITSKSFPGSAKSGERYSIKLTVEHLRLYPDKCVVKLYNSKYPSYLIAQKTLQFSLWESKDFEFSLTMGNDDQYYRIIVIDENLITSDTVQDGFNAMVRYEAVIPDPDEPFCTQDFHISLDNVGVRGTVTIGGQDYHTNSEGFGSANLIKGLNLTAVARTGVLSLSKSFTSCTSSILSFSFDSIPDPESDGIGTITHKVIKEIFNDEIKFYVPVTNTSNKETCYYLNLKDDTGKIISFSPVPSTVKNRILPGATEIMVVTTENQIIHLNDIENTTVKFELMADPTLWFGVCALTDEPYELVSSKTYKVPPHIDPPDPFIKEITIVLVLIILAMLVAKFS